MRSFPRSANPTSSSVSPMRAWSCLARQPVELTEEGEVLHRREVRVQGEILRDVADGRLRFERASSEAVDRDLALVGLDEPAQHGDGGGLPGAVGAEQPVALALADGEGDPVDGEAVAVALAEALTAQHGGRGRLRGARRVIVDRLLHCTLPKGKEDPLFASLADHGDRDRAATYASGGGESRSDTRVTGLLCRRVARYDPSNDQRIGGRGHLEDLCPVLTRGGTRPQ